MFSLSHTPAASMPPPVVLLTLRPPLNTRPQPVEAPSPLVCWRLFSCLPLVSWLVVVSTAVACLRLASPFVTLPPHASIINPPSLFAPAGCRFASLRTTSASRRAAAWQLAVSLPSPIRRRCCRQCADVFAVVAIAIVALVTRRQAASLMPLSSLSSLSTKSITIVIIIVSPRAIAIIVNFVACCAVANIADFVACCAVAIVVVAITRHAITIVIDIVVCRAVTIMVVVGGERCTSVWWRWCGCV